MGRDARSDAASPAWTLKEERRLRRLAILISAQLPDNPDQALAVLSYASQHAIACGAKGMPVCPHKAHCLEYHAAVTSQEHAPQCRANEA